MPRGPAAAGSNKCLASSVFTTPGCRAFEVNLVLPGAVAVLANS